MKKLHIDRLSDFTSLLINQTNSLKENKAISFSLLKEIDENISKIYKEIKYIQAIHIEEMKDKMESLLYSLSKSEKEIKNLNAEITQLKQNSDSSNLSNDINIDNILLSKNPELPSQNGKIENKNINLKQNISLNDRFLFQRELFNNNKNSMDDFLNHISTFDSFENIINYIKSNTKWDFNNNVVKSFISHIENRFK